MTPIDNLASPEDSYDLGYEFTDEQADRMLLSPSKSPTKDFVFTKPSTDIELPTWPPMPNVVESPQQLTVVEPNYQLRPKGICLMEPPLTQPYVWVHYKD